MVFHLFELPVGFRGIKFTEMQHISQDKIITFISERFYYSPVINTIVNCVVRSNFMTIM